MILVSACLAGCNCRYDAGSTPHPAVLSMARSGAAVPVCPEQLGGLETPRAPAEIRGGQGGDVLAGRAQVVTEDGTDVTAHFIHGARECLRLAQLFRVSRAVVKSRSPSCAVHEIYDGTFTGSCRPGPGVTTALLQQHGVEVIEETDQGVLARLLLSLQTV
ncbi:MAG TPA: DUF523 domain-containing protein [Clostridiales bacterium UBA8153]|nr:DUF523 domain-containing protein [Clostridiales bacterium UBA8153]